MPKHPFKSPFEMRSHVRGLYALSEKFVLSRIPYIAMVVLLPKHIFIFSKLNLCQIGQIQQK
jgi:hypothetical protein